MTHSAQQTAGVDFRGSVTNRAPLKQKAYLDDNGGQHPSDFLLRTSLQEAPTLSGHRPLGIDELQARHLNAQLDA